MTGERKHSETFTTHDSVNALSSHCKILVIHTYLDRSKGADGVVQKYQKKKTSRITSRVCELLKYLKTCCI